MTCMVNGQTQYLCPSYTFSSSTNQITNSNYTYDSSGDLTQNGTGTGAHTFQWDAEEQGQGAGCQVLGSRKQQIENPKSKIKNPNALGQRVEKQTKTTYDEYVYD